MPKRILVFCGGHIIAGVEIVTLAYLEALKDLGVEIYCITNAWGNGEFNERLESLNIPYSSIKLGFIYPKNIRWSLDTLWHFPPALRHIKKIISQFRPDVCYHTSFRTIFMVGAFVRTKHIYHAHDYITPSKYNKLIFKFIQNKIIQFIAVSNTVARNLIQCGVNPEKIQTLYNGILPKDQTNITRNFEILKIGIVGQVSAHKGHELLFSALAELKKDNSIKFELKIFGVGDDFYKNKLQNISKNIGIETYITWIGFKANLDEIYQDLNVIVVPTISSEPFGMVIIEAGIRNVLVLATNSGGPAEIIEDQHTGLLFQSGNVNDLKDKLRLIADNPTKNSYYTENNYQKIISDFNIKTQAFKLLQIIYN
ncbi:glycosyltransferase [Pedobacter rhizosphaerae]|nr:glycosyltransferase [Pedobacter rhizosphaerae]